MGLGDFVQEERAMNTRGIVLIFLLGVCSGFTGATLARRAHVCPPVVTPIQAGAHIGETKGGLLAFQMLPSEMPAARAAKGTPR